MNVLFIKGSYDKPHNGTTIKKTIDTLTTQGNIMRTSKLLAACALGTSLIAGSALYLPAFAQTNNAENAVSQQAQGQRMQNKGQGMQNSGQRMHNSRKGNQMQNVDTSGWISIKDAYDKVETAGYKDVHSIKRTPNGYVVKAIDADGNWARLGVDPIKGDVQALEHKRDGSNKGRKGKDQGQNQSQGQGQGQGKQ